MVSWHMKEQHICTHCKKEITSAYAIRRCLKYNEILCKDCLKYGLCPEHFEELNECDKQIFKKKYRSPNYYAWIALVIIPLILVPYFFIKLDLTGEFELWVKYSIFALEIIFWVIYSAIMIISIIYIRRVKPSLREILRNYKDSSKSRDFNPITSIESGMQKLIDYYHSNQNVQLIFQNENLIARFEFVDTNRQFLIKILRNRDISLLPYTGMEKPDIRIRIKTEQDLLDVINKNLFINDAITERRIVIKKGFLKLARLARKSPNNFGLFHS